MKNNKMMMVARNTTPTFRAEVLSYAGSGMNEEPRWKLLGIRNNEAQARELLNSEGFVRLFLCTPNGREFVDANFSAAEMAELTFG